jgi:hypothetical protein
MLALLPPATLLTLALSAAANVSAPAAAGTRHMTIDCGASWPRLPIACPDV